jgi:SAM-dependent methyltransferase
MSDMFAVATSYDRFMGRFSSPLARDFVELVAPTGRALDVGCGTGAVTRLLTERLGGTRVAAVDPSPAFVAAVRSAEPGLEARIASADSLPFSDGRFGTTLAQLVVHFMSDPVAGIAEMARVTERGGTIAASVWDFAGGRGPLGPFERAALDLDPSAPTERSVPGAAGGDLELLFDAAGVVDVRATELTVRVEFPTFADWWDPFTLGVGPAGRYVASLDVPDRHALRDHARELVPTVPFAIHATAWVALGRVR